MVISASIVESLQSLAEVWKAGAEPRAGAWGQVRQTQQSFKDAKSALFGSGSSGIRELGTAEAESRQLPQLSSFARKDPLKAAIHVPFKGGGNAATAALTGQVDFVCTNSSALMSGILGGKLRPLMVTTPKRLGEIPDTPTVRELGLPNLEVLVGWSGIAGPPNLPQAVADKWAAALQKVKGDKSWNRLTTRLGSVPRILTPAETRTFVETQYKVFSDLVQRLDMRIN